MIPEIIARRIGGVRRSRDTARAVYLAQTKICSRCSVTFSPSPKRQMDAVSWGKRQFCGRACAARGVMERPDVKKRQVAKTRARFKDPEYRERHAASARVNAARANTFSNRKKGGETRTRRVLGWIPADMKKTYVRMRESYGAARAKEMLREEMMVRGRREVAAHAEAMRVKHQRDLASRY